MSFNNRKFSMNRSSGVPRESTRLNRRFSTHEPSSSGKPGNTLIYTPFVLLRPIFKDISLLLPRRLHHYKAASAACRVRCTPRSCQWCCDSDSSALPSHLLISSYRDQLQDPSSIPKCPRRPQIPRRSRSYSCLHRCHLVYRESLRARFPR